MMSQMIQSIIDTDDMKNDVIHCFDDAVPLEMSTCRTPDDMSN